VDNGGGYVAHRADWWVYRGFTVTNGLYGIRTEGASRNVFDSLLIEGIGQEAIELAQTSTYNTVTRSTIRETSAATDWAEGIYVGTSTGNDPSNNNRIIGNWFGPNLRAEHIQLNPGTSGTVISDNHMDATGMPFKSGIISSIVGVFGSSNNTWTGNVITNVGNSSLSGFFVYESGSTNNVFHSNAVAGTFSYGFRMNGGGGNVVGCDNVESGTGALTNVACQ
jgi:hypothetical protein